MTAVIARAYVALLLVLGPVAFVYVAGPWVDRQLPVVEPFVVVEKTCERGCVTVKGYLGKRRDCRLLSVFATLTDATGFARLLEVSFLDRSEPDLVISRPPGLHAWGPWFINIPAGSGTVSLYAEHQCHPFWATRTLLDTFEVSEL